MKRADVGVLEVGRAILDAVAAAAVATELEALVVVPCLLALPLGQHDHRGVGHQRHVGLCRPRGACRGAEAEADGETDRTRDSKKSLLHG